MSTNYDVTMTAEEGLSYVRNNLIIADPEEKLLADKESFLNEVIMAMQRYAPWNNIKSLSTPHEKRHLPTLQEILGDMTAGLGGRCYTLNNFCMMLLQSLGFDVVRVPSDYEEFSECHMVLIVRNLTGGGTNHMFDVGAGCPSFRVISFDFPGDTSPVYHDSFLRYRFVRKGDVIIRQHYSDPDKVDVLENTSGDWFTYFTIYFKKYVEVDYFKDTATPFYTTVMSNAPFLTCLFCRGFIGPKNRYVSIKRTTLLLEDEEGRVQKSYFRSRDEMLEAFRKYFPQIPKCMITVAMEDENVSFDFNKELK